MTARLHVPRRAVPALACVVALALHGALLLVIDAAPPGLGEGGASYRPVTVRVIPEAERAMDAAPALALNGPEAFEPIAGRSAGPRGESPSTGGQGLVYVDARWLSKRPSPLQDIVIPPPESSSGGGPYRATLILFIGRDGTVMKIEVEDSNLPSEFESLARSAFAAAKFSPGLIGSHAVRSKLAVEVGFDVESPAT